MNMNNEQLANKYITESGKKIHSSDCATSIAPAETPGRCDCDEAQEDEDSRADRLGKEK